LQIVSKRFDNLGVLHVVAAFEQALLLAVGLVIYGMNVYRDCCIQQDFCRRERTP